MATLTIILTAFQRLDALEAFGVTTNAELEAILLHSITQRVLGEQVNKYGREAEVTEIALTRARLRGKGWIFSDS